MIAPASQPTPAESLMLQKLLEARAMYFDGLRKLSYIEPNSELLQMLGGGRFVAPQQFLQQVPAPSAPFLSGSVEQQNASTNGLDLLRAVSLAQEKPAASAVIPKVEAQAPPNRTEAASPPPSPPKSEVKTDEEGRQYVLSISDLDVLCGRGGKSNHHPGNKRYRQVVDEIKLMYRNTTTKTVKTDLSRAIVSHVYSYGGRFAKKDEESSRYYLLSKSEARKKTSQALRETKALKWTL